MARQNYKQAVKKAQLHANKQAKQRLIIRISYSALMLSLVLWAWTAIHNPRFFPIKQMVIKGHYHHVDTAALQSLLRPYLHTALFSLNSNTIQHELEALPWVETAIIHKSWLGKVTILLEEKVPIAFWGNNGLVTGQGEIFFSQKFHEEFDLPKIYSSANLMKESLGLLQQMQVMLNTIKLKINSLTLSERQAVMLELIPASGQGNIKVLLGQLETRARLQRFINVYPKVFEKRLGEVQYADMRYTNGMAVRWK